MPVGRRKIKNIKFISGFSVAGFFLSLFFGIFSHSRFSTVFFKALIFALIFGALGFGISFLYENFFDAPNPDGEREGATGAEGSVGQTVDITIEDEDLPQAEKTHGFFVGNNRQMLTAEDTSDIESDAANDAGAEDSSPAPAEERQDGNGAPVSAGVNAEPSAQGAAVLNAASASPSDFPRPKNAAEVLENTGGGSGFVPVQLGESASSPAGAGQTSAGAQSQADSGGEQLGVLPDLEEIDSLVPDSIGEEVPAEEVQTGGDNSSPAAKKRRQNPAGDNNAEAMAKAISTLLSREKE
ncbi:MAG: hypothetical protein ACTTKL_00580 [Treponema sp.]